MFKTKDTQTAFCNKCAKETLHEIYASMVTRTDTGFTVDFIIVCLSCSLRDLQGLPRRIENAS